MLTTTIDGLWALQVLSGIEVLAPELGLRPYLPSIETPRMALEHPIAAELRDVGAIDDAGAVDDTVHEWLTVVARRDVALLFYTQTPSGDRAPERVVLARLAQWWVTLERCGSTVHLSGAGTATSQHAADLLISVQIERLCGAMAPAQCRPATIDVAQLVARVNDGASLRRFLTDHHCDSDQARTLALAADTTLSAQASMVALQSGLASPTSRAVIESGAVTVIDTPSGRLVSERVVRGGRPWMIVSPGSVGNIAAAVRKMMHRLPAYDAGHSHGKAV
ncbi:MAG: ESX secretion-associated protein EspG [Mycobacterium sp.]